ncbi:hypothetical protein [Mucilaginibacter psychrotolerans]|uniref:Carboxypeptidase-like regulatory domain-containing protein n=1 Tax=Mucilaginibacter psychrotolerans TaxID=1524096 RepID=A0A4Y8S5U6_9SPHI|nr:hypothetical protein [Mucilaginibacter psychrotolerans]TFF33910.1 hypothetical protein E2R66_23825 [Mucilaginibacter psychrotolerans]
MRPLLLLITLLFLFSCAGAQVISGKLIDKETGMPVKHITITSQSGVAYTDDSGVFRLKISKTSDTIRIKTLAYKSFKLAASDWGGFMRTIELEISYKQLGEVTITAKRNYDKDSLSLRKEYAKTFNFRGPKFTEIFRSPSPYVPFAVMSIDVGMLFKAITKKHNRDYKLQQILLRDERENHVSARFNKRLLGDITRLAGDSLENFMSRYRPTAAVLDKLSDYELIQYIKNSLEKFKASGGKNDALPKLLKEGESLE